MWLVAPVASLVVARRGPRGGAERVLAAPSANAADHAAECALSADLYPGTLSPRPANAVEWHEYAFPGEGYPGGIDAYAAAPFGPGDLARVSTAPVFDAVEVQRVIDEAEAVGAWRSDALGADFSTRSCCSYAAVTDLPRTRAWLNGGALPKLMAAIHAAYPKALAGADLRVKLARLVKYNATTNDGESERLSELNMHRDGPLLTATIALNDLVDYEGGGTVFEALTPAEDYDDELATCRGACSGAASIRLERGAVLLYPGFVRHGGAAITRGLRFILVMFLLDANVVDDDRHHVGRAKHLIDDALSLDGASDRPRAARAARSREAREALLEDAVTECASALDAGADSRGEAAHCYLGLALLELGYPAAAADALEDAVRLTPRSAHALALLARARSALGEDDAALDAATRAAQADPGSLAAHNNRGVLLADRGRHRDALAAFRTALAIRDTAELRTNAAVARATLGDTTGALQDLSHALDLDPNHQRAKANLDLLRQASSSSPSRRQDQQHDR